MMERQKYEITATGGFQVSVGILFHIVVMVIQWKSLMRCVTSLCVRSSLEVRQGMCYVEKYNTFIVLSFDDKRLASRSDAGGL